MLSLSKKMPQRAGRGKGKWCSKMTSNISGAAKSQPLGFGQYQSLAPARRQTANDQTTCVRTDRRGVEPETIGISPEAKDAWIVFHDTVETALGPDGELYEIRDVAAKVADNLGGDMQIPTAKPRVKEVKDSKISKNLFYKWHHRRENIHLFTKVGGCLFVDLAALFEAWRGREA